MAAKKELTPPTLEDLLNDNRLTRLFSKNDHDCALQLWILRIKTGKTVETRIVYGRLLPYSHSCSCWSFSDKNKWEAIGQAQVQITKLNLYLKSTDCQNLLSELTAGRTLSSISEGLGFSSSNSKELNKRFGETKLDSDNLVYRPVAYLLNRDAHDRHSISSPHGGAGAFSASITQTDKETLFRLNDGYDATLTEWVVKHLNKDTGLDFGGPDSIRFGDLELLVFPALDENERPLLKVTWIGNRDALAARFNPVQVPHFKNFQFHLKITNDGQIIYSGVARAERDVTGVFDCKFELNGQLRTIIDSSEIEVFGFTSDHSDEGTLCCRWRVGYIREIHLQGQAVGYRTSPVKFDWLEKNTQPALSNRVKAALTINRGNRGFTNHIGGREADPWVPANRHLKSLFTQIHPDKSEGQFFHRRDQLDGAGQLEFVEWFKKQLTRYPQHQVIIFDPYFEDAGLGLLLLSATTNADYTIFTSLPKPKDNESTSNESAPPTSGRINNLVASCEHNQSLIKSIKLRIFGLKDGRLHDRYILFVGADGLPDAGFHLSNSLQKATENHPLLVTPIPMDVLLKVEQYKSKLVREAVQLNGKIKNPTIQCIFDSVASPVSQIPPRRYEPLSFLDKKQAGDILSVWTGEPSLCHLSGDPLRERMAVLHLLQDDSLNLPQKAGLLKLLDSQPGIFADFTGIWEVIGEILAHSHFGDSSFPELKTKLDFLEFLAEFIKASFSRAHDESNKDLAVMSAQFFQESVETLLHSSYRPSHLFYATKYAALTWSEYYAIKFLWLHSPDSLVTIAESQMTLVPMEPQIEDAVQLSLLSQILSEISLSVQFDISKDQRDRLVSSNNGLMKWMGLNAIEMQLEKPGGLSSVLRLLSEFTNQEKERAMTLGWMINRSAMNPEKKDIYKGLVAELHNSAPATITADDLNSLVDSMRGHMRQLPWTEPWLFQDVILPLLQAERANVDDAANIWIQELITLLEPKQTHGVHLFEREREGQTTNIAAFLFAHSSSDQKQRSLKSIRKVLKQQKLVIQQPLASTSNWSHWNDALMVSMWILSFARWGQYYQREQSMCDQELQELSQDAHSLAMIRPMDEWQANDIGSRGGIAAFLDQVEELLATRSAS